MKYCRNCGKELNSDIQYCPNCGASVSEEQSGKGYNYYRTGSWKIKAIRSSALSATGRKICAASYPACEKGRIYHLWGQSLVERECAGGVDTWCRDRILSW